VRDEVTYVPRLDADLDALLVVVADAVSRQVEHLVHHALGRLPVESPHVLGEPRPVLRVVRLVL
jgi:hypothetical protein